MPIVNVSVSANGDIRCDPDPVTVTGGPDVISFNLITPGYAFPLKNAIVVKNAGQDFPYATWTVQSSTTVLLDLCSFKSSYSYSVNLLEAATGRSLTVDPGINNDP